MREEEKWLVLSLTIFAEVCTQHMKREMHFVIEEIYVAVHLYTHNMEKSGKMGAR